MFIPLALETFERSTSLYDLMDSAYDAPQIREMSINLGHVSFIVWYFSFDGRPIVKSGPLTESSGYFFKFQTKSTLKFKLDGALGY